MTAVDVIASIVAILIVIKLIVIAIDKSKWHKHVVKRVYGGKSALTSIIFVVLAIVIFYYLILELSIVQIFAVMGLFSVLMGISFLQYQKELMGLVNKIYKKDLGVGMWIYAIIWVLLSIWVLYLVL